LKAYRQSADAEFFVTFLLRDDVKPAKQLQILAREDELVQRLKEIDLNETNSMITNIGKIILACAAFQDRKWDTEFQKQWKPSDRVIPLEELLDLRTQLDLKRKDQKDNESNFRQTSSSYQLRKGIQQRQQRIQQRKAYQNRFLHQNRYNGPYHTPHYHNVWRPNRQNQNQNQMSNYNDGRVSDYRTYREALTHNIKPQTEPLDLTKQTDQGRVNRSWRTSSKQRPDRQQTTRNNPNPNQMDKPATSPNQSPRHKSKPTPKPRQTNPDHNNNDRKDNKRRKRTPSKE
jgi:hypothetical protein